MIAARGAESARAAMPATGQEQQQQQPRMRESQRLIRANQSGGVKCSSFHKSARLIQQQPAVFRRRFVARELDQVAAIQKISQQRFFLVAENGEPQRCAFKNSTDVWRVTGSSNCSVT